MRFLLSAAAGLCATLMVAPSAQARTVNLTYDIQATYSDAFARGLYAPDPNSTDPYAEPVYCAHGQACYPDDWAPDLFGQGLELGDQIFASLRLSALEVHNGYLITSLSHTTTLRDGSHIGLFGWNLWSRIFDLDESTGDLNFVAYDSYSAGWNIDLAGGTGILNYQTEFGSADGTPTGCYPSGIASGYSASLGLPAPFCDAYDAEAIFTVDAYNVNVLITAPVPASAVLLASALGGGFALRRHQRRKTTAQRAA